MANDIKHASADRLRRIEYDQRRLAQSATAGDFYTANQCVDEIEREKRRRGRSL